MSNKTTKINVVEAQMREWIENKVKDLKFIENNTDEPQSIIRIYLENGLNLADAIEKHQDIYKDEAEIKAIISNENTENKVEKKLNLLITIKNLPKSKATALQTCLTQLGLEYKVEVLKNE